MQTKCKMDYFSGTMSKRVDIQSVLACLAKIYNI